MVEKLEISNFANDSTIYSCGKDVPKNKKNLICTMKNILKWLSLSFESISYLGPRIWEMLPSEMQECETLFEFKCKVKSWNPINRPCKLCKTYIGGVGNV